MAIEFTGNLIPKMSSDNLNIKCDYKWTGLGRAIEVWFSAGKRGLAGEYDQESGAYKQSVTLPTATTPLSLSISQIIPLSFWGTRDISDGAVEIVFKVGAGFDDVIVHVWNAYTINLVKAKIEIVSVYIS